MMEEDIEDKRKEEEEKKLIEQVGLLVFNYLFIFCNIAIWKNY